MSPSSDLDTQLRELLDERLTAVVPPRADLAGAVTRGRRVRNRRRMLTGAVGVVAAVAVVATGTALLGDAGGGRPDDTAVEPLGQMDFSQGLRAYADPGHTVHIGGRTVAASGLEFLDTDAVATSQGVVYYDDGDLKMVDEGGRTAVLDEGDPAGGDFHPTAKGDTGSLVAYAMSEHDRVVLKVMDTSTLQVIATRELDCSAPCGGVVIDGIDSGAVFVRDDEGTSIWEYETNREPAPFFGPGTRVADVRNHVVLYDGQGPDHAFDPVWTLVPGAIDAQLTYDGKYVLYWSSRLEPTVSSRQPVTLDQGPVDGLGFWTIDTDGTVLVAAPENNAYTVYDCEVLSGACEELGPLDPQGGDPMFIGNDM